MQILAVPKALKCWKKVYFYLLFMQYQVLYVNKSQVEIRFLFILFMFIWVSLQQFCFYIAEDTFKQKPFMADIGEKRTCTYSVHTFPDLLSDSNIDLLLYRKYGYWIIMVNIWNLYGCRCCLLCWLFTILFNFL